MKNSAFLCLTILWMIEASSGTLLVMRVIGAEQTVSAPTAFEDEATNSEALSAGHSIFSSTPHLFRPENLVAWCIVPFDAKKRGPAERAEMLVELGITRCAYDWREEHVATFEHEILEYQKRGINFFAFWSVHDEALRLFKKHQLFPQIWQIIPEPGHALADEPPRADIGQDARVLLAARAMLPLAEKTSEQNLQLGLYNHGGWSGEPENMVAVCRQLHAMGQHHVGIVYNFHHGHQDISSWKNSLEQMLPFLLCVNLNGMNTDAQPKILTIGQGQHDAEMLQVLLDSGYSGPIGIIDHQEQFDSYEVLKENLNGLSRVGSQLIAPNQADDTESADDSVSRAETEPANNPYFSQLIGQAKRRGNADRGAAVFGSDMVACVSCHALRSPVNGEVVGGTIGPELAPLLSQREPLQLVRSVYHPQEDIDENYQLWQALLVDGMIRTGYRLAQSDEFIELRDLATGEPLRIPTDDIELLSVVGSPMPDGLMERLSMQRQLDLIAFLLQLRSQNDISQAQFLALKSSMKHGPSTFPFTKEPIDAERWPHHTAPVNRDRIYDFYTKQAEFFRQSPPAPLMLTAFPGLDGGVLGHWGNQNEETWADSRWNNSLLGSVQAGVIRHQGLSVARGIGVQLGEPAELFCCFDPDTLSYPLVWKDTFLRFSDVRYGLMDGVTVAGKAIDSYRSEFEVKPDRTRYRGFYRAGARVAFAYEIDGQLYLDAPGVKNGKFVTEVAPLQLHSMRELVEGGGTLQWPEIIETEVHLGSQLPFAIDRIDLPFNNPWKSLLFLSGHDFLPDGSAMVCTVQGDVWRVDGLTPASEDQIKATARWKRFASGLHQPLGLRCSEDGIFVQCRDQLVRLVDLNGNGEADYYECYSNAFVTSPAGHDYICDLQRDAAGNFYFASGNQGLVSIGASGTAAAVLASGFRNPAGMGLMADGTLTISCSEGDWTPASMICAVDPPVLPSPQLLGPVVPRENGKPHFGYGGPRQGNPPMLPLVYLPRGLDNSSGGQAAIPTGLWGPLSGHYLHLSFGTGSWFHLLVDEVDGQKQGCIVPLTGDFDSGVQRGRFNPRDGNFYVTGMKGWGTYTTQDGCFQRIRFSGDRFQHPIACKTYRNGVLVEFAEAVDLEVAGLATSHFAQAWNYQYSGAYGSPEYSPTHYGVIGHDTFLVTKAAVLDDRRVFLEIPEMQPVSQLHLRMHVNLPEKFPTLNPSGSGHDLFLTVHRMREDFRDYADYEMMEKKETVHPLINDIAVAVNPHKNPWLNPIEGIELYIDIKTGKNLSFETGEIRVRANQPIALTLSNPDVVPHNWVLVSPGQLAEIGKMVDQMTASSDGYRRHYVPDNPHVLAYTDMVMPDQQQTIYLHAPDAPGRYPFLCTFPGHWMVMNGVMVVE